VLDASPTVAEIAGGDLTGDGVEEIVVATLDQGILYLQQEGEAWVVRHVTRLPANYHSVALADMDGNGRLDVVATIEYPNRFSDSANVVRIFQNTAAEPCR
jgi:hypothetical protein